ncbi:MAG: hypothetical protein LRY54_03720 [Alphaproteobacteria bacterium]|nr:hypothetical protein [Alphaproteobacteria bacterium]
MLRLFIHFLVIAGLVLSTISPACAFIGGQGNDSIQICGADGQVKEVTVAEDFNPEALLKGAGKSSPSPSKQLSQQCPFCVSFHSLQADAPAIVIITPVQLTADVISSGPGSIVFASAPSLGFSPTGPPEFSFM